MPAIRDREEGNARRRERLAGFKRGPGVFVYNGKAVDVEFIPTPKLTGADEAMTDSDGNPVFDSAGRQKFKQAGRHVTDDEGHTVMGGEPRAIRHRIETFTIRGQEFPSDKPVRVADTTLALKLRGMDCFEEVGEDDARSVATDSRGTGKTSWQDIRRLAKDKAVEFTPATKKDELLAKLAEAGVTLE